MSVELPKGVKYKVYKTDKYTIYYVMDEVELGGFEKRMVKGGHEFLYYGNAVVIRPIKQISQGREAPSV